VATSPPLPNSSSETRIFRDTEVARGEFRERRLDDPLRDFTQHYPDAEAAAAAVVNALSAILQSPTDRALVAKLVGSKNTYSALRSLAASPISADDLQTLLRSKVNKKALASSQDLADSLGSLLKDCLDPKRFPWVAAARPATPAELGMAKLATAVLTTVSAVQAMRRGDERKALEGRVQEILVAQGFIKVTKPQGGIQTPRQLPAAGEFMMSCKLGEHNADFVVGLLDGRTLAIECKASNSEVNGYKRLNKEVVVDAGDWMRKFGETSIVAAAALRGVFKPSNVAQAQSQKVHLFWWHRMRALERFLDDARP